MIVAIIGIIFAVAIMVTFFACCKISGDCSREEEKRDVKNQ